MKRCLSNDAALVHRKFPDESALPQGSLRVSNTLLRYSGSLLRCLTALCPGVEHKTERRADCSIDRLSRSHPLDWHLPLIMKHATVLVAFATSAFAQSVRIAEPVANQTFAPGSNMIVSVEKPVRGTCYTSSRFSRTRLTFNVLSGLALWSRRRLGGNWCPLLRWRLPSSRRTARRTRLRRLQRRLQPPAYPR